MDRPADKAKKALDLSMYMRHDIDAFVRQYGVEPGDAIWAALCRLEELEADQDLMIKKSDEDFENAIEARLEEEAKKRRENRDTGWSGPAW